MPTAFPPKGRLFHVVPPWVRDGAVFHIRVRCAPSSIRRLTDTDVGRPIIDSVRQYHAEGRWWCRLFLLMPDHLHALITFPRAAGMSATIKQWKSYHTRTNHLSWQEGYFDHRIRSVYELDEKGHYIRQNPVTKGLCETPEDWPWVIDLKALENE